MERTLHGWHSPALDRRMDVAEWGDRGAPVLVFPTAGGDYLECERFLLIKVLTPLIEAGRARVFSCASVSGDGWLDKDAHPAHKSWLQSRFDEYLVHELVPFLRHRVGDPEARLVATGASLGAYNAVNASAKHPDAFGLCVAMSGTYRLDRWMDGHTDGNYYFNDPLRFVPNLPDGPQLERLRETRFHIASGRGKWEAPWESAELGAVLGAKGVPNYVDLWGEDVDHNWPTWRTMLPMFLDRLLPQS